MIIDDIVAAKKREIDIIKSTTSYKELEKQACASPKPTSFKQAINKPGLSLIAEIKKASPSRGIIRKDFDPASLAARFVQQNASALSVLTDQEFFQGSNEYLAIAKRTVKIPVLQKDFILDEIQILESRKTGADAILLITAILNKSRLQALYKLATSLGMDVLCEVHNTRDLHIALDTPCEIIGINNRDLKTFTVDFNNTISLKPRIPTSRLVVCESGITTEEQLRTLQKNKIDAVLIGEGLATNPELLEFFK